jgi:hypothetical protein
VKLRLLGAILIVCSAALPFYTCTKYVDESGKQVKVESEAQLPPGVHPLVESHRPIAEFDLRDPGKYLIMLAFLWPLGMLGARAAWRGRIARRVTLALESLLLAGSAFLFYEYSDIGDRAWGVWVGFAGLLVYAVGWLSDLRSRRWLGSS